MTAFAADALSSNQIKAEIRSTLKGPVLKTLRQLLPTLWHIPEQFAYDHIMGSIHLLDMCLKTFRRQRERFRDVLVDASGKDVLDDTSCLRCGRAVSDVVAMVVRTSARRYFTRHSPEMSEEALIQAEELYDSIKDFLLYDWQVPLVPTYAQMTSVQARKLGPKLLELDTRGKLARALGHAQPSKKVKAKLRSLEEVIATGSAPLKFKRGEKSKQEREKNKEVIGTAGTPTKAITAPSAAQNTSILASLDARAIALLANGIGLNRPELVLLLQGAHMNLGDQRFLKIFGHDADPVMLDRLIQHAKKARLGPKSTQGDIAMFVNQVFGRVKISA